VAVIVDEKSCLYANPLTDESGLATLLNSFRAQYYRIGAPVAIYLLDDLVAGKVPAAKMYILLNLFRLEDSQLRAIRAEVCNTDRTIVWMHAPGIVSNNTLSEKHVSEVVGVNLKKIEYGDGSIVLETSGDRFNATHKHLSPTFAVDDTKSTPLARHLSENSPADVAVAEKNLKGYTSVYCGVLQLPSALLRSLAQKAGVHIYNDQDQIIVAGNGFAAIHATSDGTQSLHMPAKCTATDALSGEQLGTKLIFTFEMKTGDTRVIRVK